MGYFGIPFRNGVPIGLGSVASFGAQQFDPSSLFIGGTAGTWYDPSDPTTLFTTSAGTTPCAVPGSGSQVLAGLMLDKSQGAPGALGAELVTNGDFSQGSTGWTADPGWSISGGTANASAAGGGTSVYQFASIVTGKTYRFSFTISNYVSGSCFATLFNSSNGPIVSGNGTYSCVITKTGALLAIGVAVSSAFTGSIDNISVREIPGNHAIAFNDTTARPELSARVNLLTYSEQFDNGAWAKAGVGTGSAPVVTANAATAPDGTQTADLVAFNRGAGNTLGDNSLLVQTVTVSNATSYIGTLYVRAATAGDIGKQIAIRHAGASGYQITTLTANYVRIERAETSISASASFEISIRGTITADNSVSVFLWGADLRPANIGSAIPSYQRIEDQYTYDSNGFPSYLRFDGVDDSMYTPASINFSGTDKMSVFAGARKLSDAAAAGTVIELSTSADGGNNGTFFLRAPTGATTNYQYYSKGTIGAAVTPSPYAAPITNVITCQSNISSPLSSVRIDGTQVGINITSQGTGNFGTYPLFIGARNNASLRFNGHLYSLVVVGSTVPAGSITATEQYVAEKTGIQI